MRKFWVGLLVGMVCVSGCKRKASPPVVASIPVTQEKQPDFEWKRVSDETFVIKPGETKAFALPAEGERLKVELHAVWSVDAGMMRKATLDALHGDVPDSVGSDTFRDLPCSLMAATKDEARCAVEPGVPAVFVVRDPRATLSDPVATILGRQGNAQNITTEGMTPNEVKLEMYVWECVADCPAPAPVDGTSETK